jgi:hypothetical protein
MFLVVVFVIEYLFLFILGYEWTSNWKRRISFHFLFGELCETYHEEPQILSDLYVK